MRESELIVEYIQSTAAYAEKTPPEPEPVETEIILLCNRLERLNDILTHVHQYALEEFVGAFTRASSKLGSYNRFVHDDLDIKI